MRAKARDSVPISPLAPGGTAAGSPRPKASTALVIATSGRVSERASSIASAIASSTVEAAASRIESRAAIAAAITRP
jgi:hypothetical protein